MSIAAISSQQYSSVQASSSAASSVSADGSGSTVSSSTTASSSTAASSTTVSSDLGSWLMSMGIGDDPAVQLMAALLTLAILQELMGEESSDEDSADLLASLGQWGFFASSSYSSSTFISSTTTTTTYGGQGTAEVGGELDVTTGAAVADSGGATEPAPTEGPVLDTVA